MIMDKNPIITHLLHNFPDSASGTNKTRKRKSSAKESPASSSTNSKRSKQNKDHANPPTDYIHVRARRGQATDSHSIAERARREKISERMKLLQGLVPGCYRVTGKAVMLDEIINYVQSLHRQVEFLSMKLATINPSLELNADAILSAQVRESLTQSISFLEDRLPLGKSIPSSSETQTQFQFDSLPSTDGFDLAEAPAFWDNDLLSVVQMGFRDSLQQRINCTEPTLQMKLEPER